MFVSGPSPFFFKLGVLLGKQAAKGIMDNVLNTTAVDDKIA